MDEENSDLLLTPAMDEENSDLLLTPKAKNNSEFERAYPFPIVTSECKENETDPNWKISEGYLEDGCVLVHDEDSMKMLYTMGFFGKGTLSKNGPKICFQKKTPKSVEQKQTFAASSPAVDIIDLADSDNEGSESKTSNGDDVFIPESSDNDDCGKVKVLKQPDSEEKESLVLSFQEAYFLSYGLGSLIVKYKGQMMNLRSLWNKFCELTPSGNFPFMYAAYHHFRSKGWVVKSGVKYGTDYVLYKDGPPFYHATYSVIVRAAKESLNEYRSNRDLTWGSVVALNRVNSNAGKGLLFLYVINSQGVPLNSPLCISKFEIAEVLCKQWVAEENI